MLTGKDNGAIRRVADIADLGEVGVETPITEGLGPRQAKTKLPVRKVPDEPAGLHCISGITVPIAGQQYSGFGSPHLIKKKRKNHGKANLAIPAETAKQSKAIIVSPGTRM